MMKVGKVVVLFTITTMALALPLVAQNVESGPTTTLQSNTKKATAEVFNSSVDDYIDTRNWPGVSFENWFGFATGDMSGTIPKGSFGYARKFGGLYLGAWYKGNILQMTGSPKVVKTISAQDDRLAQTLDSTTTTTDYNNAWINSTNQLTLLLGVGGQGIKLGFFESMATDRNEGAPYRTITEVDTKDGFIDYTNKTVEYSQSKGHLRPYLGWGTAFGSSVTIKPYIDVAFDMYSEEMIDNYKDNHKTFNGRLVGDDKTIYDTGWNSGYYLPLATVGSDFVKAGESATTTIGVKYDFSMYLYNNAYDVAGISGSAAGPVYWYNASTTITQTIDQTDTTHAATFGFADKTNQNHSFTPSYKITGEPVSGLKLGFRMLVPVSFSMSATDNYTETYNNSETVQVNNVERSNNTTTTSITRRNEGLEETLSLSASPTLAVGASFKLIPNRFTVNGGIYARPLAYTYSTTKKSPNGVNQITTTTSVDGNGVLIAETVTLDDTYIKDEISHTETWNQFYGEVRAGFVFDFSPQFSVDLFTAAGTTDRFTLDITDVNVLFTFRF